MTLDELELELAVQAKPCRSCELGNPLPSVIEKLPPHVFLMADGEGKTRFMQMTEDGRVVPCEEW